MHSLTRPVAVGLPRTAGHVGGAVHGAGDSGLSVRLASGRDHLQVAEGAVGPVDHLPDPLLAALIAALAEAGPYELSVLRAEVRRHPTGVPEHLAVQVEDVGSPVSHARVCLQKIEI